MKTLCSGGLIEVGAAVREEDRRRPGRDAQARSEFVLVLRLQVARIDGDGESPAGN